MPTRAFFHPKSLVEKGARVGSGSRVWAFAHVMKGAWIGNDCSIGDHSFVEKGARIGNRVTVKNGVSIWDAVTIHDECFIGPNVAFTNDLLPISRRQTPFVPTVIGQGACLGANSTIVCGITVGRYAFIGAGAVVTQNIPDYALAIGNPARFKDFLCACRQKLRFKRSQARCVCGNAYRKVRGRVVASDG